MATPSSKASHPITRVCPLNEPDAGMICPWQRHPGELHPRVGFIITDRSRPAAMTSPATTSAACASNGSRRERARSDGHGWLVSLAQGSSRGRGDFLDGGNALSTAPLRLPCRRSRGLTVLGDVQNHGEASSDNNHASRDDFGLADRLGIGRRRKFFEAGWLDAKFLLVLVLSGLHGYFVKIVKEFAQNKNRHSGTFYRQINEVPTILMIAIVVLVIVKPF